MVELCKNSGYVYVAEWAAKAHYLPTPTCLPLKTSLTPSWRFHLLPFFCHSSNKLPAL